MLCNSGSPSPRDKPSASRIGATREKSTEVRHRRLRTALPRTENGASRCGQGPRLAAAWQATRRRLEPSSVESGPRRELFGGDSSPLPLSKLKAVTEQSVNSVTAGNRKRGLAAVNQSHQTLRQSYSARTVPQAREQCGPLLFEASLLGRFVARIEHVPS